MDKQLQTRLYGLHPDFRMRIENHLNYHPEFDPEKEIYFSETALSLFRDLKGEGPIFMWTLADREKRLSVDVKDIGLLTDDELDHVGRLALQYVRNPLSVKDVTIYKED